MCNISGGMWGSFTTDLPQIYLLPMFRSTMGGYNFDDFVTDKFGEPFPQYMVGSDSISPFLWFIFKAKNAA